MKNAGFIFVIVLWVAAIIGEILCVVKFFRCDFEPSYKAEAITGFRIYKDKNKIISRTENY